MKILRIWQIWVLPKYLKVWADPFLSLRGAKTKYFHVMALSNGSFVLEPRALVDPEKIPARTLKMLESSVTALKKGEVSAPIDLSPFLGH